MNFQPSIRPRGACAVAQRLNGGGKFDDREDTPSACGARRLAVARGLGGSVEGECQATLVPMAQDLTHSRCGMQYAVIEKADARHPRRWR